MFIQLLSALVTLFTSVIVTYIVFSLSAAAVLVDQERCAVYVELCRLSQ